MLPIVHRELQVAARSRNFHKWRLRTGTCLVFVSLVIILFTRGGLRPGSANEGFRTLCFFALLLCLAEGIRKTSDAISQEKREGTLGFLFLTDLKGFDVILGKLAAAAVRSFNVLLAFVPMLAVTLLLGGTTGGEFWRMALGLAVSLGASLSICIFTSTISRERSLGTAAIFLVLICVLPLTLQVLVPAPGRDWISAASPFSLLFNAASDVVYRRTSGIYWVGIAWLVVVSAFSILAASTVLPRVWQDRPRQTTASPNRREATPKELQRRRQMLDRNPAVWLMFDHRGRRTLHWFVYIVGVGAAALIVLLHFGFPGRNLNLPIQLHLAVASVAAGAITLAAYLYTAREASRNLAEARQNGALELILSTPLTVDAVIQGQVLAVRRALVRPAAVLCFLVIYILILSIRTSEVPTVLMGLKTVAECILGIFTVGWFGMWMALISKSATRAYLKTAAIGIFLPYLVCTPTILNQLVLLVLAVDNVKHHFRRHVAERYVGTHTFGLSPVSPQPAAPPVLR